VPARGKQVSDEKTLLEKLLAVQLYTLGVPQANIAKIVGRQKLWVNSLLKGIPIKGEKRNRR
jgi:hypothetical protein